MATARELLEHADALMKRNRARDAALAETAPVAQPVPIAVVPQPGAHEGIRPSAEDDDVPLLTDVVEDFDPISITGLPDDAVAAAEWPDFDDDDAVVIEGARPGADRPEPVVEDRDAESGRASTSATDADGMPGASVDVADATAAAARSESADGGMATAARDAARWNALAEEVRMQVLQRIDIFTDTGLQEQLAARLQPIVDRASADLVAAINHHVGQLMRSYVAEAIEREIDKWRQGGGS